LPLDLVEDLLGLLLDLARLLQHLIRWGSRGRPQPSTQSETEAARREDQQAEQSDPRETLARPGSCVGRSGSFFRRHAASLGGEGWQTGRPRPLSSPGRCERTGTGRRRGHRGPRIHRSC
jgi:hypothetical protein